MSLESDEQFNKNRQITKRYSMKTMIKILLTCIIMTIMLVHISCSAGGKVLACFDGGTVTLAEAESAYNALDTADQSQMSNDRDQFFKLVRKIALEKILVALALEKGLDQDPLFLDRMAESEKKVGFETLWNKEVADKVIVRKDDYRQYMQLYEVYQIARRTDILEETEIVASEKLLKKLASSITSLQDFIEASKTHSQDETRANGGYLGLLRPGIMDEAFDNVMTKIEPGSVSEVFQTSVGLHIIYVNSVSSLTLDDLLTDELLFEQIKNEKTAAMEEQWFQSLLSDKHISIDYSALDAGNDDSKPVITCKDKVVTRGEIYTILESFKNNLFPDPTKEEINSFVEKQALNIVLESLISTKKVLNSKEYKERISNEKDFLLSRLYIERYTKQAPITEEAMLDYYEKNRDSLFTFNLDNGTVYIQPYSELGGFITQKLQEEYIQQGRYDLYQSVTENAHLKIEEPELDLLIDLVQEQL